MLGDRDAAVALAVADLDVAREFYETVVGLSAVGTDVPDAVLYTSGSTPVLVYRSEFAGTNRATAVSWAVGGDFDEVVADLRDRGVGFEHYDLPETEREGDVHVMGELRSAWFKDPDGNILNVVNQ